MKYLLVVSSLLQYSSTFQALVVLLQFLGDQGFVASKLKKTNLTAMARPACAAMIPMSRNRLVCASARLNTGYKFRTRNRTDQANPTDTEIHCIALIIGENGKIWIMATRSDYPSKLRQRRENVYAFSGGGVVRLGSRQASHHIHKDTKFQVKKARSHTTS